MYCAWISRWPVSGRISLDVWLSAMNGFNGTVVASETASTPGIARNRPAVSSIRATKRSRV
jgi:hypothetical protein